MRWTASFLALVGLLLLARAASAADAPPVVKLWPGKAPGDVSPIEEEKFVSKPGDKVTRLTNVSVPTITIHRPAPDKDTGTAVVIAPGGGYSILAWAHEGEDVATWLNSIGITGVLLKYRVPRRPEDPKDGTPTSALQDVQRALGLVRHNAKEWGIDPKRIGILGFSAGGNLAAAASTRYETRAYEPIDEADKVSCRPDFAVLVYAGGLLAKEKAELVPEIKVTKDTPPTLLVHADDDKGVENSPVYYLALKKAGVPAEMHIYGSGGHGFGMLKKDHPSDTWPERCAEWFRDRGYLKAAKQ